MDKPIADRVKNIKQSDIRRFSAICAQMNGVNLSQGVCDQPAPIEVKEAAKTAIDQDQAIYTNLRGTIDLRKAVADKMGRFNQVTCDPETEVAVNVGSAGSFACTVLATLNAGDECIVFSPFYSYHVNLLKMMGVNVRFVDLVAPSWSYSSEALTAAVTDKTRMILVNTPANPSGKVFSETELLEIADLANRHNLWIVTDEIYEYITYDHPHISMAKFAQARDRTVTISGASKTFAVTGWRVGYTVGPAELIDRIGVVSDLFYICAPAPLQAGITAGLAMPDSYYEKMRADYLAKRELIVDTLRGIGFSPHVPAGSYYLLASFDPDRWDNATQATESILNEVGVATVPGSAFYANPDDGKYQLRFCYAKQMPDLEDACSRLRRIGGASRKAEQASSVSQGDS